MKRDMTLIYEDLEFLEEEGPTVDTPFYPTFTEDQIQYHMSLCQQAGFITTIHNPTPRTTLTWKGHDVLDNFRFSY